MKALLYALPVLAALAAWGWRSQIRRAARRHVSFEYDLGSLDILPG